MYVTKEFLTHFIMNIEMKLHKEMISNLDMIEYWQTDDDSPRVSAKDICEFINQIQQTDLDIVFNQ